MFRIKRAWMAAGLALSVLLGSAVAAESQDIWYTGRAGEAMNHRTAVVSRGTFEKEVTAQATVYYPINYEIAFEENGARFVEYTVSRGDQVKAGDVLVIVEASVSEAEVKRLELALERARDEMKEGVRSREEAISQFRIDMSAQRDSQERQKMSVQLRRLQTELDRYKNNQSYEIVRLTKELEEAQDSEQIGRLTAPADGVIEEIAYKKAGAELKQGEVLIKMYSPEVVLLRADNTGNKFRCGMSVIISSGSGAQKTEMTGTVVGCDEAAPAGEKTGYAYVMMDEYNANVKLRNLKISASNVYLQNVLLVPKGAVKNESGKSYVELLQEERIYKRYVNIGMSGTANAWVIEGVSEGDVLIVD